MEKNSVNWLGVNLRSNGEFQYNTDPIIQSLQNYNIRYGGLKVGIL